MQEVVLHLGDVVSLASSCINADYSVVVSLHANIRENVSFQELLTSFGFTPFHLGNHHCGQAWVTDSTPGIRYASLPESEGQRLEKR